MKNSDILLTPGPVPLSDETRQELSREMVHHRSSEFKEILSRVRKNLQHIFQTKEHVYLLNASGTGAMEASLVNTMSAGDQVLTIHAGKFGKRWTEMAQAYGLVVHELQVPLGQAVSTAEVEKKLKTHPQIKAVLMQSCETSTGTLHPVEEISSLVKNRPHVLLIVDAVSALIAVDLPMDAWGMDVLIGGSQKSFALPAGMAFLALSQKAQKFQKESKCPAYYFDLEKEQKAYLKNFTAFTTNVSYVRALDVNLNYFLKKGVVSIRKQITCLSDSTKLFCHCLGLSLFSSSPSPSVTAISIPTNGLKVKAFMQEHGVMAGGGQDELEGRIIRMGHLGSISPSDHIRALRVFGQAIKEQSPNLFSSQQLDQACLKAEKLLKNSNLWDKTKPNS